MPQVFDVVLRLDDDRPNSERPQAMVGMPMIRLGDRSARNLDPASQDVAGQAAFDVRYGAEVPSRP